MEFTYVNYYRALWFAVWVGCRIVLLSSESLRCLFIPTSSFPSFYEFFNFIVFCFCLGATPRSFQVLLIAHIPVVFRVLYEMLGIKHGLAVCKAWHPINILSFQSAHLSLKIIRQPQFQNVLIQNFSEYKIILDYTLWNYWLRIMFYTSSMFLVFLKIVLQNGWDN